MGWRGGVDVRARRLGATIAAVFALLVLPAVAQGASWTALVVGDSTSSNSVTPIDVATDSAGGLINAGNNPFGIAVSADGSTAYVADFNTDNGGTNGVTPIDLTSNQPEPEIPTGTLQPLTLAVVPGGAALWVADTHGNIEKIDLTQNPPVAGSPINDGTSDGAENIALSPDGRTAYIVDSNEGQVTPIDLTHQPLPSAGTPIHVGTTPASAGAQCGPAVSSCPFGVGISPDGSKLFVADADSGQLSVVDTGTKAVTNVDLPAGGAYQVAVAGDGSTVWVTQLHAHDVVPVLVSGTPTVGAPIPVSFPDNTTNGSPQAIAISPDDRHLFVGDGYFSAGQKGDQTIDLTLPAGTASGPIASGQTLRAAVVTPDQAPVANFTVNAAPAGQTTTFDASSSVAEVGSIARYDWDFGDGTGATTGTPTTSHAYAANGSYTATLTVTDSAGTSTTQVYTGQSMLRNGGPGARASRSVTVSAAPQPAVKLSTASLDLGVVGVGASSAPQAVTITNTGGAPLNVTRSTLAGTNAGDFKLGSDGCAGATVPAGGSCSVSITFAPQSTGARGATLAFDDNASGSPHTVLLTGTGINHNLVSGTVRSQAGGPPTPLAGASVSMCPQPLTGTGCVFQTTGIDGSYQFSDLPRGVWSMEVRPSLSDASLFPSSALVTVAPGTVLTQDFVLSPITPLSGGVAINGISTGNPVVYFDAPFTLSVPVDIAHHEPAGLVDTYTLTFGIGPSSGSTDPAADALAHIGVRLTVRYDGSGKPVLTGVTDIAETDKSGIRPMFQGVAQLDTAPAALPGSASQLDRVTVIADTHRQFHGAMELSIRREHVFSRAASASPDRAHDHEPGCDSLDDCGASCPPESAPEATGAACDGDEDDRTPNDPSGRVVSRTGVPLLGATVTLERSAKRSGPFTALHNHSAYLARWTPLDPERGDPLGRFAWDVFDGYYRVRATHAGCRSATTRVYHVPPPVIGIRLVLSCPHLVRTPTRTRVSIHRRAGGTVVLVATVRPRRGSGKHPAGEIVFKGTHRVLGTVAVSARSGTARLVLPARLAHAIRATYSGDGRFLPSRSVRVR